MNTFAMPPSYCTIWKVNGVHDANFRKNVEALPLCVDTLRVSAFATPFLAQGGGLKPRNSSDCNSLILRSWRGSKSDGHCYVHSTLICLQFIISLAAR